MGQRRKALWRFGGGDRVREQGGVTCTLPARSCTATATSDHPQFGALVAADLREPVAPLCPHHHTHLLWVLRACVKHVHQGLQAGRHKLVHLNVGTVKGHAADAVLDVSLPSHLPGHAEAAGATWAMGDRRARRLSCRGQRWQTQ
jgi:hypothetical protein